MQYLSKAYSYYSGINPATLSGAIDVIVVRHVDTEGEVALSSSPFHIRFGKLQVLRAGEKRVTMRLPNNLPPPHVAPFDMKVGEAGEAFFVLETDEPVPEELLTSPIVMPTTTDLPPSPPPSDDHFSSPRPPTPPTGSLTQQPFGQTEQQGYQERGKTLGEVDFLDLDASDETHTAPSSSFLGKATSLLPTIPFITPTSSGSASPDPIEDEVPAHKTDEPVTAGSAQPPNPLAAAPGEAEEMPLHDSKLSEVASSEDTLPRVPAGQGEGPQVVYGKDVVLDISGYHSSGAATEGGIEREAQSIQERRAWLEYGDSEERKAKLSAEKFISDLSSTLSRPSMSLKRATDPSVPLADFISDSPAARSSPDLPAALASLSLESPRPLRRHDRGQSEPPPDFDEEIPDNIPRDASPSNRRFRLPGSPTNLSRPLNGTILSQTVTPRRSSEMERSASGPIGPTAKHSNHGRSPAHGEEDAGGRLKNVEENPYLFVYEAASGLSHTFELSLCGSADFARDGIASDVEKDVFSRQRISFQRFIEDPELVDDPRLVVQYGKIFLTWANSYRLLFVLAMYRRSLSPPGSVSMPSLAALGVDSSASAPAVSGYGWSRWWRRGQSSATTSEPPQPPAPAPVPAPATTDAAKPVPEKHYAKTLRLSSDQLKQLNLKPGPNTVQFSVTSSYSGMATCSARIFLWEETDQIVISDIDGTITKSDALGHLYAAIGRDWTHLGIAKLYTDICNNGYKMLYLTSRAIGQADSTREYLRSICQGDYRLPEGPVIMSPDRLMASLHREVIMRKPELFKMACLRDVQRLFGDQAKEAFFAGFGNRITDAMSYRSVGIEASKIYTIDSTGVVKTELLQAAGHKGSYIQLNDLVNETFPPVSTKFKPEFTDFNYWRSSIPDVPLPDLSPPSPALSARSDSSRYSVLGKMIRRRPSKQPLLPTSDPEPSSRPSSPLMRPAVTPDNLSDTEIDDGRRSRSSSMPGSFEDRSNGFPASFEERDLEAGQPEEEEEVREGDSFDDGAIFDDDILATGEMRNVPF